MAQWADYSKMVDICKMALNGKMVQLGQKRLKWRKMAQIGKIALIAETHKISQIAQNGLHFCEIG